MIIVVGISNRLVIVAPHRQVATYIVILYLWHFEIIIIMEEDAFPSSSTILE
jgi:hypothetical protein